MEIISTSLSLGLTCPGDLLQSLLRSQPAEVAALKTLQLSYASSEVTYQCALACADLRVVHDFIVAIDALEEISVLYFEREQQNDDLLWRAVLHHAKSLRRLSVHAPPKWRGQGAWNAERVRAVGDGLGRLEMLEVDLGVGEAEGLLLKSKSESESVSVSVSGTESGTGPSNDNDNGNNNNNKIINELAKLTHSNPHLTSLLVNIPLNDAATSFAGEHTWNAMGSTSFPEPDRQACERLARILLGRLSPGLKTLELRFPRRCMDDRCQFWTLACSVILRVEEGGDCDGDGYEDKVVVEHKAWGEYLPAWPEYGGYLWNLMQKRRA